MSNSSVPFSWVTKPGGWKVLLLEIFLFAGVGIFSQGFLKNNMPSLLVGSVILGYGITIFAEIVTQKPGRNMTVNKEDITKREDKYPLRKYLMQSSKTSWKRYVFTISIAFFIVLFCSLMNQYMFIVPIRINYPLYWAVSLGTIYIVCSIYGISTDTYRWKTYQKYVKKLGVSFKLIQAAYEKFELQNEKKTNEWTKEWLVETITRKTTSTM